MNDSKKLDYIIEKLGCLDDKVNKLDDKVNTLDDKVNKLDDKVNKLDDKVNRLDDRVGKLDVKVEELNTRTGKVEYNVTDIRLTLENETNRNIMRVAEGHLDLSRKLDEALRIDNEKEMMAIRVTILENETRRIKEKINQTA